MINILNGVFGRKSSEEEKKSHETYFGISFIIGLIAFLVIWIYAIAEWGLLLGLMFGWIPALIGSIMIGVLWPLFVIVIIAIVLFTIFVIVINK